MKEPVLRDREPFAVLGVYQRINPATADWDAIWGKCFMPRLEEIQSLRTDDCFYGVYAESDEEGLDDFWAGVAVRNVEKVPEGLSLCEVPAAREAVFECSIATLGATWRFIHDEWLPSSPFRHHCSVPGYERYPPGADRGEAPVTVHVPLLSRDK